MNKTSSSTIELTIKSNQDHRSQVIPKGRRQPKRDSSRPQSTKERQDALKKLKLYRKRNQKNKKFSHKIIYIKEKEIQKAKIKPSTKILSKHQKQAKEDKKAKSFIDLNSVNQHELEPTLTSSISTDNHHPEEKSTHNNDTTTNSNSLNTIFIDEDDSTQTIQTSKVDTLRFNRQQVSNIIDRTTTNDNVNENVTNSNDEVNVNTDTVTLTGSTSTNTTVMDSTTDCITGESDLNGLNTEDTVIESKKNRCIWWSIVSGIGGFILLFTVYYYGTSVLQDKYKQDIENYMNQIPSKEKYWMNHKSIDSSFNTFEVFQKQNTDTKCTWISHSQRKTIFKVKLEEKYREKIDEFFQKYTQQMTMQYAKQESARGNPYVGIWLADEFTQVESFYETKINYTPLTNYFQQKKAKLKGSKEIIPVQVTLSGFTNDDFKINGLYKIQSFDNSHLPVYALPYDPATRTSMNIKYDCWSKTWKIEPVNVYGYGAYVEWKNTENVSHPGQFKTAEAVYVEKKNEIPMPQLKMTTQLFPQIQKASQKVTKK